MKSDDSQKDEASSPLLSDPTVSGRAGLHYAALDGIRGLAILLVILFHGFLGVNWTSPFDAKLIQIPLVGWIGVDVFFVLSGFLITGILLDTRKSSYRFRNFYARRFLRIFPAYWGMLGFIFLVLPLLKPFDTEGLRTIQENQGWLWSYLTNIGYIVHRRAWAWADWLNLGHLWSLAIEEQFYLVWPFIVFAMPPRWLKIACVCCIVGSPTLRCALWVLDMRSGALYFPTPCRLDGLGMGALAAVLLRELPPCMLAKYTRAAAMLGSAIVASMVVWRSSFNFNDRPTIVFGIVGVCLLAVAAILLAIDQSTWLSRAFSHPILRSAGKYSYAAYLFHGPLRTPLETLLPDATLTAVFGSELLGRSVFVMAFIVVSFAAAFLSWHLYEKHWLKLKHHFDYRTTKFYPRSVEDREAVPGNR
jgi:peptidoglycan/LPS O-acetylase OafA/YrhL